MRATVFSHFCHAGSPLPLTRSSLCLLLLSYSLLSILLPQRKDAEPDKPGPPEASLPEQSEQPPEAGDAEPAARPPSEVSEVEIPSVGRILVRADADGYDEEVQRRAQGQLLVVGLGCQAAGHAWRRVAAF